MLVVISMIELTGIRSWDSIVRQSMGRCVGWAEVGSGQVRYGGKVHRRIHWSLNNGQALVSSNLDSWTFLAIRT